MMAVAGPWLRLAAGLAGLAAGLALLARGLAAAAGDPSPRGRLPLVLAAGAGLVGAVALQSSSLCVAGLLAAADARRLDLAEAWAAVAGANVGTTLLSHLVAWRAPWPLLAIAAALAAVALAHPRARRAGRAALGAVLLLSGSSVLVGALGPGTLPVAPHLLRLAAGPAGGPFLLGVGATAAFFSSHFTIAVAQGLAAAGALPTRAGIAFVCGANVGTTADVLVASVAGAPRARATAGFHLGFNLVLAALALVLLGPLHGLIRATGAGPAHLLAQVHTALNLATALLLLPWLRPAARAIARRLPPDPGGVL